MTKTFLFDQDRIAGNVYVQTPLWRAKIHLLRPIPTLSDGEIAALWQALHDILQGSIDAGGPPFELNLYGQKGGWDDAYLFHWEEGAPSRACGTPLAKIRTGSTASYICPGCQKLWRGAYHTISMAGGRNFLSSLGLFDVGIKHAGILVHRCMRSQSGTAYSGDEADYRRCLGGIHRLSHLLGRIIIPPKKGVMAWT